MDEVLGTEENELDIEKRSVCRQGPALYERADSNDDRSERMR